ncbi:MAG: hypothetical protein HQM13_03510 [SAR324 cluster bacterium]|nr:hypothetical protein [SAR324 cluster bacterium]
MKGMRLEDIMDDLGKPENKRWFAWAIAGMVMADGKMSKPEEKYMRELFLQYGDSEISTEIAETMKKNTKIQLDSLVLEDRGVAARILKYLVVIAAIDQDIPKAERDYLHLIGKKIGFSGNSVMATLAWRKRELARQADGKKDENEMTLQLKNEIPRYK